MSIKKSALPGLSALSVLFALTACGGAQQSEPGLSAHDAAPDTASDNTPGNTENPTNTQSDPDVQSELDGQAGQRQLQQPQDAALSIQSGHRETIRIEAENYDNYYDTTPYNQGGAYRSDGVDIEVTSDEGGGYNVGWIESDEWLEFEVVLEAGHYEVLARVASESIGGEISLQLGAETIGGAELAVTGDWQAWETPSVGEFSVTHFDSYTLRVNMLEGGFNLNWLELVPVDSPDTGDGPGELGQVQITALESGGARFSLRLPEAMPTVHLFARTNGSQDYVVTDLQSQPGGEVQLGDGSYLYSSERESAYVEGDLLEARFYSFSPDAGQIFYPGPGDDSWEAISYQEGGSGSGESSSSSQSSSTGESSSSEPSSSSSSSSSEQSSSSSSSAPTDPDLGAVVPLYDSNTPLEPAITYETEDALITRISDRARDRHAKEDQFQTYDHYLSFYWEHRTAAIEIVDRVAKGGETIRMNVRTQWRLNDTEAENRWFYMGNNTVAEYCDNGTMEVVDDLNYYKERSHNCREGRAIQVGDKLEFEISQFLDPSVPNGRAPYYGTTFLYIVGEGLVPWDVGGATPSGGIKDSVKIPESAWLGGDTTIHADTSGEPHNRFLQMATNLGYENAQPFVEGRRVLHTSFVDGTHDELPLENPEFEEMVGKSGPRYINESCSDCHVRNGRAVPEAIGEHLDKWVFRVGDEHGNAHPYMGQVLQPQANSGAQSEGEVFIASWTDEANGLRSPNYEFTGVTPERFSGRIAPQLVGMGLLEAIPEAAILAQEDPEDASGNGISGRAHRVVDPASGETRLGRFGWKAGKVSIEHQVVSALNTDMGVMTSALPDPDCGSEQTDCGPSGSQLEDEYVDDLVKYIALLGVPPQRDWDSPAVQSGEALFDDIGCAGCHTPSFQTSEYHPLAELRNQTIYPYSDLLLHDMGPELADNLGEGDASGSEWRTTPLWGLGHSACVTGGMTNAGQGDRECTPEEGYLHDGRARTIEEAILWHGGEGQASRDEYQALSQQQKDDLLSFLESL